MSIDIRRLHYLNNSTNFGQGAVVYWMNRDQRANDNWALLFAQQEALKLGRPLLVFFNLDANFESANLRHFSFMLQGLSELEKSLASKNIPFILLQGKVENNLPLFIKKENVAVLVTDFSPLAIKQLWLKKITPQITCPFIEVDAHNIVPCRLASPKREFGAYTIRPKINRLLNDFLSDFPKLKKHPFSWSQKESKYDWKKILEDLPIDRSVPPVTFPLSGEKEALKLFKHFVKNTIASYQDKKNTPYIDSTSRLSAYFHFGQLSAQRVAYQIQKEIPTKYASVFLEELIIRRELSDNFCFYTPDYEKISCFPDWAKKTLKAHAPDKRPYHYTFKQFENAKTHDELWNAAQKQMLKTGYMHGYMRMYWAKKIFEWTPSVEVALKTAIALNDKYELDGRDPNGYTGIAWSLGGVHDRAWGERPIFGKIRYMALSGCKNKFDILAYIKMTSAPES